jgi:hypothetical protein
MESKPKSLGRAYLIDKLRELGWSRRDSAGIVKLVLNEMIQALKRGESVEFPLGTLRRVRNQRTRQRGWFLGRIRTIYKRPYTVKHELNEEGYKLLNGKKYRGARSGGPGHTHSPESKARIAASTLAYSRKGIPAELDGIALRLRRKRGP